MNKIFGSLVVVMAFAGFAAAETKIDATKILGKWEVTMSTSDATKGTIVEFKKDGKLAVEFDADGKKVELVGTYKIEGDKLKVIISVMGSDTAEETDTIKSLTDKEFVTIDKNKKETTFKKK